MIIGSSFVRARSGGADIFSKLLSLLISLVLALSLVPGTAWAEADEAGVEPRANGVLPASGEVDAAAPMAVDIAPGADAALGQNAGGQAASDAVASSEAAGGEPSDEPALSGGAGAADLPETANATASGESFEPAAISSSEPSEPEAADASVFAASGTLEEAVKKLEDAFFKPVAAYGKDTNVNDIVKAKLASLGYEDVSVTTKTAVPRSANDHAVGGISSDAGDANGAISYFFMDPDDAAGTYANYMTMRQYDCTFVLEQGGRTCEYAPRSPATIPWDEGRVTALLEEKTATLAVGYAAGDAAGSVVQNVTLPYKLTSDSGAKKSWSSVSWKSDSSQVVISGYGWSDYAGVVTRTASDDAVVLTARVSMGGISSGGPDSSIEKAFAITVKGDPAQIEAEKAALQKKVDGAFSVEALSYSDGSTEFDASAVTGDVQLPRPSAIGVDGKYYAVSYAASNDSLVVNGYRGSVYRPLPGERALQVEVTLTVADKSNAAIVATKTVSMAVAPLEQVEINAEIELMESARAGYAAALANGQDVDAVSSDMHAFQKAYRDDSGACAWAYDAASADAAGDGIVPVDLDGYDAMGSAGWRLFKSSSPAIVKHENLLVAQPANDMQVTVTSSLSSQKYARYAARYPQDETFEKLANQSVSGTFTVLGASGHESPKVEATCTVIGMDENGAAQVWAAEDSFVLGGGATAADVSEALFAKAGLKAVFGIGTWGWELTSITSPYHEDQKLGYDPSTGRFWQLFVNGAAAATGAGGAVLQPGDNVTWCYSAWGDSAPSDNDVVPNPGASRPSYDSAWPGYAGGGAGGAVTTAPVPTDTVDLAWTSSLKAATDWATNVSDPIIVNDDVYIAVGAKLYIKDAATGRTKAEGLLAGKIDSIARMVYADGVVVVPLSGGRLQALTADKLATVWLTSELPGTTQGGSQQSLSTLTVADGYVYFGTASADYATSYGGFLQCVSLKDGSIRWSFENDASGFYWAGAAVSRGHVLVGDDAGIVRSIDVSTGSVTSTVGLGAGVRTSVVLSEDGSTAYAVTVDGVLHKLSIAADGSLDKVRSVKFGTSSTATPTLAHGKVVVCGTSLEGYANNWGGTSYYGLVAVIDAATLVLEQSMSSVEGGGHLPADAKSAPLVSVQGARTYVYFTCNAAPGGVYRYQVGDAAAQAVYTPTGDLANYCMASVVAGADGTLYYLNDSGNLFALKGPAVEPGDPSGPGQGGSDGGNGEGPGAGGSDGGGGAEDGVDSEPGKNEASNAGSSDAVAAAHAPLAGAPAQSFAASRPAGTVASESGARGNADAAPTPRKDGASVDAQARTADFGSAPQDDGFYGVNPWAAGGLALGVAGLAGAAAYAIQARRRKGMEGSGR